MSNTTYYQGNRDLILNRAKDCYENDQGRSREEARDKYRHLPEVEKIKREDTEETDTTICLKKRKKKTKRISKKLS